MTKWTYAVIDTRHQSKTTLGHVRSLHRLFPAAMAKCRPAWQKAPSPHNRKCPCLPVIWRVRGFSVGQAVMFAPDPAARPLTLDLQIRFSRHVAQREIAVPVRTESGNWRIPEGTFGRAKKEVG